MCFCGARSFPDSPFSVGNRESQQVSQGVTFDPPPAPTAFSMNPFYDALPGGSNTPFSYYSSGESFVDHADIVDLVYETIRMMSVEDYIELQGRLNGLFGTVMVSD